VVEFANETTLEPTRSHFLVRFGAFELDLRTRELRKDHVSAGVPEQSVTILAMLIERPGELVLREEIRSKLWPNDTIVEFDHSINTAIRRLRLALGDSADNPHYIETLARRGYRWLVPVQWIEAPQENTSRSEPERGSERFTAVDGNLIGKRVAHYRVLEVLGGGGMGVVYQAEDLRLGRRVALKFLPEELLSDPAALQRFESEARSASALNHPNICTIYGVEEYDGQPFLAMELLQGQTLRDLIVTIEPGKTALELAKFLDLAVQITAGLEAAHRQGVIHRDIKPANIFITNQGQAKILDFGLAKLFQEESTQSNLAEPIHESESLRASSPFLSRTGVAMGTAGYMSPEQIRGQKLDARTDLFSFGLVLYEMATARRPFTGDTAPALHNAILNDSLVPAREWNPELPAKFEAIITRALEKDREKRYQTAEEIRADLESLQRATERRSPATRWWQIIAVAVAILFVTAATFWYANRRPRTEASALSIVPFTAFPGQEVAPTFSPDGTKIAFAWTGDPASESKGFDLYVKTIGSEAVLRLTTHPSEFISPAWSPDGTQIAFHRFAGPDTGLFVVPVLGGAERRLRPTRIISGLSAPIAWSPDGKWIAFVDPEAGSGEERINLLSLETLKSIQIPHEPSCLYERVPAFSHDSKQLAYSCIGDSLEGSIYSVAVAGGSPKYLYSGASFPGMVWARDDSQLLLSMDHGGGGELWELTLADGSLRKLPFGQGLAWPAISAKGDKIAFTVSADNINIWRKDLLHPKLTAVKLIASTREQANPNYSPDGKHIAFESTRGGFREIWVSDADGSNLVQISKFTNNVTGTPRWSPDSAKIVFDSWRSGKPELYIIDISELIPRKLVTNLSGMFQPSWSHDGKWIYFLSGSLQASRVYRCPVEGGIATELSSESAFVLHESFDGESVYFVDGWFNARLKKISLSQGRRESPVIGVPRLKDAALWTVVPRGIYFVPSNAPHSICYFDFASRQVQQITEVDRDFNILNGGMTVSPDGRWLLYSQVDESTSDIMLVDHFR
jgi:serine/threonine protein kinase/Tol biopolymer transport system component